jgi:hypothetical protein
MLAAVCCRVTVDETERGREGERERGDERERWGSKVEQMRDLCLGSWSSE